MKKSVILAVLGMVAGVASSYGQGSIQFNTYAANSSSGYIAMQGNGANAGLVVPDGWTEVLLYSITPITDSASTASAPLTAGWTVASTGVIGNTGVAGTAVASPNLPFVLNSYSSGQVYFEFAVFSGSSYANSLVGGQFAGHSASFTDAMATGTTFPWYADGDPSALKGSGSGILAPTFNVFTVVPEPTTLALAGLGGLASLIAFRRKQA